MLRKIRKLNTPYLARVVDDSLEIRKYGRDDREQYSAGTGCFSVPTYWDDFSDLVFNAVRNFTRSSECPDRAEWCSVKKQEINDGYVFLISPLISK